jgi:hypothetical protein
MSLPSKRMAPPSLVAMPDSWWMSVVLPAPFGPMTACSSPGSTSSVTSLVTRRAP